MMKTKMMMITAPILCLLAIVGMIPPPCIAKGYRNSLKTGESLETSEFLSSGNYLLMMQPNCNLVLYHNAEDLWSTKTGGRGYSCSAKFLRGGNLVVYSSKGVSLWESSFGTKGPEYVLALQKDGNVSFGETDPEYVLVLQKDGDVVVYGPAKWTVAWPKGNTVPDQWLVSPVPTNILYSGERLKADESLILGSFNCTMQTDCNFACRDGTETVWATNTTGNGSECYFELASQEKLVLYDSANSRLWGTGDCADESYVLLIQKFPILAIYGPKFWSTDTAGNRRP